MVVVIVMMVSDIIVNVTYHVPGMLQEAWVTQVLSWVD